MPDLKYLGYAITFQETPDEVSIAFNISGCPYRCDECHSPYLWEDAGEPLLENLDRVIKNYESMVTCVCFMGGDQNLTELSYALALVKTAYRLKTCVYSGADTVEKFSPIIKFIDYLKIGSFKKQLGGLSSKTTNQRMYHIEHKNDSDYYEDITFKFWKE